MFIETVNHNVALIDERFAFSGHEHSEWEIVIGVRGKTALTLSDKKTFVLGKNDFYLVPPNTFHLMWASVHPAAFYYSFFNADMKVLKDISEANRLLNLEEIGMGDFWRETERNSDVYDQEIRLRNVLALLLSVSKHLSALPQKKEIVKSEGILREEIEERLRDMVRKNIAYFHRRAEIAGFFSLEEHYFSQKIKRLTGYTVMELYYRAKIEIAREYLREGYNVNETASLLGFSNQYHFSRKYKEIIGYPPSSEKVR